MIRGTVTQGEAIVRLVVRNEDAGTREVEAVIDTGFTDYLTLSDDIVDGLSLLPRGSESFTLADGSEVDLMLYRVEVLWNGQWVPVLAAGVNDSILIGMSLLRGFRLIIDVEPNGLVTIERLAEINEG